MRSRNTENHSIENNEEVVKYQGKQYIILKYMHEQKHVVFNISETDRREREINDKVQVLVAVTA